MIDGRLDELAFLTGGTHLSDSLFSGLKRSVSAPRYKLDPLLVVLCDLPEMWYQSVTLAHNVVVLGKYLLTITTVIAIHETLDVAAAAPFSPRCRRQTKLVGAWLAVTGHVLSRGSVSNQVVL